MNDLYTCPVCNATFGTRHITDWTHCADCGAHGQHECPGPVDWAARLSRAAHHTEALKREWVRRAKQLRNYIPYNYEQEAT